MGFNSFWCLNHDLVDEIKDNPNIGKLLDLCPSTRKDSQELAVGLGIRLGALTCEFQAHADTEALAVVGNLRIDILTTTYWHGQTEESRNLELLKQFANKMGYRIVKKTAKK